MQWAFCWLPLVFALYGASSLAVALAASMMAGLHNLVLVRTSRRLMRS